MSRQGTANHTLSLLYLPNGYDDLSKSILGWSHDKVQISFPNLCCNHSNHCPNLKICCHWSLDKVKAKCRYPYFICALSAVYSYNVIKSRLVNAKIKGRCMHFSCALSRLMFNCFIYDVRKFFRPFDPPSPQLTLVCIFTQPPLISSLTLPGPPLKDGCHKWKLPYLNKMGFMLFMWCPQLEAVNT